MGPWCPGVELPNHRDTRFPVGRPTAERHADLRSSRFLVDAHPVHPLPVSDDSFPCGRQTTLLEATSDSPGALARAVTSSPAEPPAIRPGLCRTPPHSITPVGGTLGVIAIVKAPSLLVHAGLLTSHSR